MSKRDAEGQAEGDKGTYHDDEPGMGGDRPRQPPAAQVARRKILSAKGAKGSSQRSSRGASPAIAGGPPVPNPFAQAFQPPASSSFNFTAPGAMPGPSFGGQPQQNGTSFGAALQSGTGSFGGFGNNQITATPSFSFPPATSQPQPNGFNPSTSFNFGGSNRDDTPSSSFTFGQSRPQSQPQSQQNGLTPSTATTSVFGGSFGEQQTQSQKTNGGTFSFGPTPQEQAPETTPKFTFGVGVGKNTDSIFAGMQNKSNNSKLGMFTQLQAKEQETPSTIPSSAFGGQNGLANGEQSSNRASLFSFGQPDDKSKEQTPKPSNPFSMINQQTGTTQETSKPINPFMGFGVGSSRATEVSSNMTPNRSGIFSNGAKPDQPKQDSLFKFEQPHIQPEQAMQAPPSSIPPLTFGGRQQYEDTSMLSPETTPQKTARPLMSTQEETSSNPIPQPVAPSAAEPETQTDTNAGKSLFERISRDPTATAPKLAGLMNNNFSNTSTTSSVSNMLAQSQGAATVALPPSSLLPPASVGDAPFSQFKPSTTTASPPASTAQQQLPPLKTLGPAAITNTASNNPDTEQQTLEVLNEGFLAHLQAEDPSNDWSVICDYYIRESAKITGKEIPKSAKVPSQQPTAKSQPPATSDPPAIQNGVLHAVTPAPHGHSKPLSSSDLVSPPKATAWNMFSQPEASPNPLGSKRAPSETAPASKKRPAEDDLEKDAPHLAGLPTEKRVKASTFQDFPRLPDNASNTAKLFASTLEKPAPSPTAKSITPWNAPISKVANETEQPDIERTAGSMNFGPPPDVLAKVREQEAAKKAEPRKEFVPPPTFAPSTTSIFSPAKHATSGSDRSNEVSKASTSGFTPPTSDHGFTPSTTSTFSPPKPTVAEAAKPLEGSQAPNTGLKPSTLPSSAASGMPSFAAPDANSGSFLAAFGKKADANAEKERKKRKMEEYDSEEEDEAAWEARDKQKQAEMKMRLEEAAKSSRGFVFKPSESASQAKSAFALPQNQETPNSSVDAATNEASNPASTASGAFAVQPAATPFSGFNSGQTASSNGEKDSEADKAQAEKDQGRGDHTWKPETPLKFAPSTESAFGTTPVTAPAANPFGGLFGSNTKVGNGMAGGVNKLAPPALGFHFGPAAGSLGTSRATTPGLTTDGEGSTAGDEAEASEEPSDKQVEDMAALLPEEREVNDVLFEASVAKAMKFEQRKTEDGMVPAWVEKGKGPLYLLKHKTTGKTTILLKIAPLGKVAMNFEPMKGGEYKQHAGNAKKLTGMFVDHLSSGKDKAVKPSTWFIQVREEKEAAEIARILMEGRPS